jgi:hypothetical protein
MRRRRALAMRRLHRAAPSTVAAPNSASPGTTVPSSVAMPSSVVELYLHSARLPPPPTSSTCGIAAMARCSCDMENLAGVFLHDATIEDFFANFGLCFCIIRTICLVQSLCGFAPSQSWKDFAGIIFALMLH